MVDGTYIQYWRSSDKEDIQELVTCKAIVKIEHVGSEVNIAIGDVDVDKMLFSFTMNGMPTGKLWTTFNWAHSIEVITTDSYEEARIKKNFKVELAPDVTSHFMRNLGWVTLHLKVHGTDYYILTPEHSQRKNEFRVMMKQVGFNEQFNHPVEFYHITANSSGICVYPRHKETVSSSPYFLLYSKPLSVEIIFKILIDGLTLEILREHTIQTLNAKYNQNDLVWKNIGDLSGVCYLHAMDDKFNLALGDKTLAPRVLVEVIHTVETMGKVNISSPSMHPIDTLTQAIALIRQGPFTEQHILETCVGMYNRVCLPHTIIQDSMDSASEWGIFGRITAQ